MKCNVCGKRLTNRWSIQRGMGPVCARKMAKGLVGMQIKMFDEERARQNVDMMSLGLIVGKNCEHCDKMTLHRVLNGRKVQCLECENVIEGHCWVYL